jgi:hypothetical protein
MKKLWLTLAVAGMTLSSMAQSRRIEAEIDPIAYALKGYSVHGIHVNKRLRTDLGIFGIEQPSGFGGNKGFGIYTAGAGLKINYLLDKDEHWFAGVGLGYSHNRITHQETSVSKNQRLGSAGIHLGYRWFMFSRNEGGWKNLYLAPWVSVDYNMPINKIDFEAASYRQKKVTLFPTVHVGYRFSK